MKEKKYGLFTAITMLVGIVIGSGIFFKSDNILVATNGNILVGALVFAIASLCVIFGCLNIAELASRSDKAGGVIGYAEQFVGKRFACILGWFQTLLYYPTLTAVVSWVTGIYTCILLGIDGTLEMQMGIGIIYVGFIFIVNMLSAKIGGIFQNISTIIKVIPLILIAVVGLFFSDFTTLTSQDMSILGTTTWLAAIAPVAFSFDGWICATSISHEVKNSKKNMPLALIFAPLFILAVYLIYFVGISLLVGPEQVMALGDEHVNVAAKMIFGEFGAKLILIFVIISVAGTVNGLTLGLIRLPYSLALENMIPMADKLKKVDKKSNLPINSGFVALIVIIFWLAVHYLTQKFNLLPNADVSEISIVMAYLLYIPLYLQVYKLGKKGEIKGFAKGKFVPIMGILGSGIILLGGLQNPLFLYYCIFCLIVIISAVVFYNKTNKAN